MKFQLIRNASIKLQYAGKSLLIDPMLCPKDTFPPFAKGLLRNPTVDLSMPIDDVLEGIDAVLVTHSHPDHFDDLSKELLPKDTPLFCTPVDQDYDKFKAFRQKTVVETTVQWEGISITRIEGQHGSGPILPHMGKVSGYILQADNEPSTYIISDSILTDTIKQAIQDYQPDLLIANAGGGIFPPFEAYPVMMDEQQVIQLINETPTAKVIAIHLESIDFCRVTRQSLRAAADAQSISEEQLFIPADGEILFFQEEKNQ